MIICLTMFDGFVSFFLHQNDPETNKLVRNLVSPIKGTKAGSMASNINLIKMSWKLIAVTAVQKIILAKVIEAEMCLITKASQWMVFSVLLPIWMIAS